MKRSTLRLLGLPAGRLAPPLILRWADAFHARAGRWPRVLSGDIPEVPGETWQRVDNALREGTRGLPGGSSLARLLAERRGVRNRADSPRLTEAQILEWADEHRARTGGWPGQASGLVHAAPGEKWATVNRCLREGLRGLPRGGSVHALLKRERGKPKHAGALTEVAAVRADTGPRTAGTRGRPQAWAAACR